MLTLIKWTMVPTLSHLPPKHPTTFTHTCPYHLLHTSSCPATEHPLQHFLKSPSPMPMHLLPSPEGPSHLKEARLPLIGGQSLQVVSEQCPLQVADGHVTDVATWVTAHTSHPLRGESQSRGRGEIATTNTNTLVHTTNHTIHNISTCPSNL